LGGFGKVVEIDESVLPGNPKYGKGHKNDHGNAVWVEQDEQVWVFGRIERGDQTPSCKESDQGEERRPSKLLMIAERLVQCLRLTNSVLITTSKNT
jgi:hypothetical protein